MRSSVAGSARNAFSSARVPVFAASVRPRRQRIALRRRNFLQLPAQPQRVVRAVGTISGEEGRIRLHPVRIRGLLTHDSSEPCIVLRQPLTA